MIDHPLTDEMIEDLWTKPYELDESIDFQVIRAAYDKGRDDRLEQVINAWNQILQDEIGNVWAKGTNEFGINRRRYSLFLENPILAEFDNVLTQMLSQQQQQEDNNA